VLRDIRLFAMAAQMWTAKIRERRMARAVAWIVAAAVVTNFALLTNPSVSTAPLYQLTNEWCSWVLDKDPQGGLECSEYTSPVTFSCANQTALMFSEPWVMPKVVDWAFEGLLGLIFIVTFFGASRKRFGLVVVAQENHLTATTTLLRSGSSGKLGDEYRRDAYSAGPRNPPKATSCIMRTVILATVFVGIAAYALTYLSSKSNAVSATLGVFPGTSNSPPG